MSKRMNEESLQAAYDAACEEVIQLEAVTSELRSMHNEDMERIAELEQAMSKRKWTMDSCGPASIVYRDGEQFSAAELIDEAFAAREPATEAPQCDYTRNVSGVEGHVCCMLGPRHAGPHAIDDAVVEMLAQHISALERERDEARRHAEAFRYSWAVEIGVGRKRVKREEPFPWEEK